MSPPRRKAGAARSKAGRKPARGSVRSKAAKRPSAKRGAAAGRKKAAGPPSAPKPQPALHRPAGTRRRGRPRKRPPVELTGVPLRSGPGPMSKLGTKYHCFSCQAKFYDLNRPEPICPKCGADQRDKPKKGA